MSILLCKYCSNKRKPIIQYPLKAAQEQFTQKISDMIMEPSERTIEQLEEELIRVRLELDEFVKAGKIPENLRDILLQIDRLEQAIVSKQLD